MKYLIEYSETNTYVVAVEADTAAQAKQMVRDGAYDREVPVTFGPRRSIKIAEQN